MDSIKTCFAVRETKPETKNYLNGFAFPFMGDISHYRQESAIGQGTYGVVSKARHIATNQLVAVKRVGACDDNGLSLTALRESRLLQLLKHENVVTLMEVCLDKSRDKKIYDACLYYIFEYCEYDLGGLISSRGVQFSLGHIKEVMRQLFGALFHIHTRKVLHRDLKPANVLLTKAGVVKLADFGMARASDETKTIPASRFTSLVVTSWYRPPEILLGAKEYDIEVDMWSAGCLLAEMFSRKPILPGRTDQDQLCLILKLCGSIVPEDWPGVENLELYKRLQLSTKTQKRQVKNFLKTFTHDTHAHDLLDKLLQLSPSKRIDANTALDHDFFWTDPMPSDLGAWLKQYDPKHSSLPFMNLDVTVSTIAGPEKIQSRVKNFQCRSKSMQQTK